jgi:hypothetical protein
VRLHDIHAIAADILKRSERLPNGCRVFTGGRNEKGYGQIRRNGRIYRTHKAIYEAKHGPLPPGILVCHSCDNPPCIEESHLFAGTPKVNTADMTAKGRARGRFRPGIVSQPTKLSAAEAQQIRKEYAEGNITQTELAKRYNTRQGHISNIVLGRTWRTA